MVIECENFDKMPEACYVLGLCHYYKADFELAIRSLTTAINAGGHPHAFAVKLKASHLMFVLNSGKSQLSIQNTSLFCMCYDFQVIKVVRMGIMDRQSILILMVSKLIPQMKPL